ncbi:hypothetical protein HK101_005571 [Irineochytrium annulatum]|nr:hypothetical protein HK101_005571 [Irineochytrium annulatum]
MLDSESPSRCAGTGSLLSLPDEIIGDIASWLHPHEVCRLLMLSRRTTTTKSVLGVEFARANLLHFMAEREESKQQPSGELENEREREREPGEPSDAVMARLRSLNWARLGFPYMVAHLSAQGTFTGSIFRTFYNPLAPRQDLTTSSEIFSTIAKALSTAATRTYLRLEPDSYFALNWSALHSAPHCLASLLASAARGGEEVPSEILSRLFLRAVRTNKIVVVKKLMEVACPEEATLQLALLCACSRGLVECVAVLVGDKVVAVNASVEGKGKRRILIENGRSMSTKCGELAVSQHNLASTSPTATADPAADQNEAICVAAEFGQHSVVRYLLSTGRVNTSDQDHRAFTGACKRGRGRIVRLLLRRAPPPTTVQERGLRLAVTNGRVDVVRALAEVARVDTHLDREFALREACRLGFWDMARMLVAAGWADPAVAIREASKDSEHKLAFRLVQLMVWDMWRRAGKMGFSMQGKGRRVDSVITVGDKSKGVAVAA